MYISTAQALTIYDELLKASYGDNSYGGDTAEIYLYTMIPHRPSYPSDKDVYLRKVIVDCLDEFKVICDQFLENNPNHEIVIYGIELNEFIELCHDPNNDIPHRLHVKITSVVEETAE